MGPAVAASVKLLVVDAAGKPLNDAVVFLESREARTLVRPAETVAMAQLAKQFSPRVLVAPVGGAVGFPNRLTRGWTNIMCLPRPFAWRSPRARSWTIHSGRKTP